MKVSLIFGSTRRYIDLEILPALLAIQDMHASHLPFCTKRRARALRE